MDLGGAAFPHELHQLTGGGATDYRVVDENHSPPLDGRGDRIELEADSPVTQHLARLDEGPPHVAVLDEPVGVGDAGFEGEPLSGRYAGLRDRHHHIGLDGMLHGEASTHLVPGGVDVLPVELGIGPGEVDELEYAELGIGRLERERSTASPRGVDDHHLSGGDLPDEAGTEDVEPGRLRGDDPSVVAQATEAKRPEPVGIADSDEPALIHQRQRKGSLEGRQDLDEGHFETPVVGSLVLDRPGNRLDHQLGVGGAPGSITDRRPGRAALVRFPLWARAIEVVPIWRWTGWAFSQQLEPVVE